MIRFTLIVVKNENAAPVAVRRMKKACNAEGLSHTNYTAARCAAETLSHMSGVDRVVMTRVSEDNAGTWRRGKQS